ncbi:MAG: ribonuclease III [bacterium]|nr:ribonuclease III [bacterium]
MQESYDVLESALGAQFNNKEFLAEALTHRSYLNEAPKWPHRHNERLEFLGDAVIELAVTEKLFREFPDLPEGDLTVYRAALVNYQILARVAAGLGLESHIYMSRGERGDNAKAKEVILANAMEAVVGAIYLDQGFPAAEAFIARFVMVNLAEVLKTKSYKDAKSELQEIVQESRKITPNYKVLGEEGPAHQKVFRVGVYIGEEKVAEGSGNSKQEAELDAAKAALASYK